MLQKVRNSIKEAIYLLASYIHLATGKVVGTTSAYETEKEKSESGRTISRTALVQGRIVYNKGTEKG